MGRYYSGDIEGKFWFAVQSSDDAEFFGGEVIEPTAITYLFTEEYDSESLKAGIKKCKKALGKYKKEIDAFFSKKEFWNDEELIKYLKVDKEKEHELLKWYARLLLGKKILAKVKETGRCEFEAEY